ncbi:MAG: type IX secretion system sortase PorU, partial [Ignavibacteriae bacterium]|nr:type IX secretion system sortase PorU [Ignavibacteriota bacterium]
MKTNLALLLTAVVLALNPVFSGVRAHDVSILHSTGQSIQIEFRPSYYAPQPVAFNGKTFVQYNFEGSSQISSMRQAGEPDLAYKLLPLAFQSKQGNAIQILAADYEDIPNVELKPVPVLAVKDEMLVVQDLAPNAERYSQNRFLPGTVAELGAINESRSMLLGGLHVYPLQYNPATKTLRKYTRIVVEVVFAASSAQRVENDDHELNGGILNFDQATSWKFGKAQSLNRTNANNPSVLASGTWYRLTVTDDGMYLLDANWFTSNGISLTGLNPRKIRIFNNGGRELPEYVLTPRPADLVENAIYVAGESDGQFNAGDYVAFYGKGVQGAYYDQIGRTMRHYINHYGSANYYWLTYDGAADGKRMDSVVVTGAGYVPASFLDIAWVEPDQVNLIKSGKNWLSSPISPGASQTRTLALPGLIQEVPRTYRYTLAGASYQGSSFRVWEGTTLLETLPIYPISTFGYAYATDRTSEFVSAAPLSGSTSQMRFEFSSSEASATGWLDWAEVIYRRSFDPVNNALRFRAPDTSATVEYHLGQFTGTVGVYNVTDYANVKRVISSGGFYRAVETAGQTSEYAAAAGSGYRQPSAVTKVETPVSLRGIAGQYDYIIITSSEFTSAANRLKDHRQNPAYGGFRTIIVDVNRIYNEFSGGVPDVTAIRDFLKYAYENWDVQVKPKFVCFLGQASYDYRGIMGKKSSYVPTWQGGTEYDDVANTATDDFFTRIGVGFNPWFVGGRLNARSTTEADQLVSKVIAYDTRSVHDQWKMRALYIADDGLAEYPEGEEHTRGAENVANRTPDIFEKKKIYTEEYATVITTQGRRKPGAYQDIIDVMSNGVLLVNFTGHGNPTLWTHESIFTTASSIPSLTNNNKFFVLFAATCNFSQFDDLGRASGSELLMNRTDAGAIGVVSASRKVYSAQNQQLNSGVYEQMFGRDIYGRYVTERVGTALYRYKQYSNDDNDEKYFWLGDPAMKLQYPQGFVTIDSINGQPVDSVNGQVRATAIQLKSLARVTVKGSVRTDSNTISSGYSGALTLSINDATRRIIIPSFGTFSYLTPGSLIYRGENSVAQGRFSATFVVPKDISYSDSTTRGRLVAYVKDNAGDGAGYTPNIWIGGTDTSATVDTVGPSMRIMLGNNYEGSQGFMPGDVVNESPTLYVDLVDSSGINTSTSGVGHRIEAWINN